MQATAEFQLIPIGEGVSVRSQVSRVVAMLKHSGLLIETHASGTNIEGPLDEILRIVEHIHQAMHDNGTVRIVSYLKLETRTDKLPTLAGKRLTD